MYWNLKLKLFLGHANWTNWCSFIRHVWCTVWNIKKICEVWYLVYKIRGASVAGKQNIQHYVSTVRPLLTSKPCPVIQEDSYWSATLNESGIDNWTLQNALLCLLTLKLSAPRLSRGMLFYAGALLNVWNPHSSAVSTAFFEKPRLPLLSHEARRESLLWKCKFKLVLGTTKGTFLSFRMRLNRF